jgi:hypothetical protein
MKNIVNEDGSDRIRKLLDEMHSERRRMTRDEMVECINSEGLYSVRRIDFDNRCLTGNVAFVSKSKGGRYALLITDERGNLTTDESFQCVEEAYYSLVRHLETLKSFQ